MPLLIKNQDKEHNAYRLPLHDISIQIADSNTIQLAWAKLIRQESYFYAIIIQLRNNEASHYPQKYGNYRVTYYTKACVHINGFYSGAYTKYIQQLYGNCCGYYNGNQPSDLKNKDNKSYNLDNNNKKNNLNNTCSNASIKIEDLVINSWYNTQVIKQREDYIEDLFCLVGAPLGGRFS